MKWLEKICNALANPKYKNTRHAWIDRTPDGIPKSACALGELLLQSSIKKGKDEMTALAIRRSIENYYRVPAKIRGHVFNKINQWNANGKTKKQIAVLLKKEYGK